MYFFSINSDRFQMDSLDMTNVIRIYRSISVCHKIFVHTYCRNFLVLGVVVGIIVFVISAFQLIMLHSEGNPIITFGFTCCSIVSIIVLNYVCKFTNTLTNSSETLLGVLNGKANRKTHQLVLQSYSMLKIPYGEFFSIGRETMLSIGGFSMDILISWILEYIAMKWSQKYVYYIYTRPQVAASP